MTNKEQFEQLERNHKVFQPESPSKFNMGNKDKDKNQGDSAATKGTLGDSITKPLGCPSCQPQSQLGERSQGCHPSQASSRGHSKGDGQGSHTLPGYT